MIGEKIEHYIQYEDFFIFFFKRLLQFGMQYIHFLGNKKLQSFEIVFKALIQRLTK